MVYLVDLHQTVIIGITHRVRLIAAFLLNDSHNKGEIHVVAFGQIINELLHVRIKGNAQRNKEGIFTLITHGHITIKNLTVRRAAIDQGFGFGLAGMGNRTDCKPNNRKDQGDNDPRSDNAVSNGAPLDRL